MSETFQIFDIATTSKQKYNRKKYKTKGFYRLRSVVFFTIKNES